MDLAAHGGIDFNALSPELLMALRLGLKGKMMAGPIMLIFDPFLSIGLTKRDLGNKERLGIPVRVGFSRRRS